MGQFGVNKTQIRLGDMDVEVWLRDRSGHRATGHLAKLEDTRLHVDVSDHCSAVFVTGAKVTLDVRMPDLDEPIRARATVAQRSIGRAGRQYELLLENDDRLLPFTVQATLNRRRAVRVDATQGEQIFATLPNPSGGDGVRVPITDISNHGLGLQLTFPQDRALAVGDVVELQVDFLSEPPRGWTSTGHETWMQTTSVPLRARVFHARAVGSIVFMGLGFLESDSMAVARATVAEYIARAQNSQ